MSRAAKILLVSSMFAHFAFEALGPIYAIFVKEIGGDILEAGAAYGVFMIVSGVFIFTIGRTKFFLGRLHMMVVVGYALLTLGEAGYLLVSKPLHLFIVQVVLGIATGILEPSWDAVYASDLDEGRAAAQWSLWAGGRNLATGLAAFAGSAIVAAYSFTALFIVMLAFNIVAWAIVSKLLFARKDLQT